MKKLLTFLLLITALTSSAQVYQNDPSYGRSIDRYEVRKDLGIPTFCGVPTVNSTVTNKAKIAYDSCGGLFYIFNPATQIWSTISGSAFVQDGLISGGIVSWSGSGLTFDITSAVFRKFGVLYNTNDTTITLNAPDLTYSRIDLFALDTSNGGEVIKITGTPSPTPVAPQTQDFQIALTTGITLNVGDTVPSSVSIQKIYDENIEWATAGSGGVTVNFNDAGNPFTGVKDALISTYSSIARLQFTRTGTGVIDGSEVLKMHINLRKALSSGNGIKVLFLNGSTPISNIVPISSNNGLASNTVNQYQTIAMPISDFTFTSSSYNRIIIYATGYDTSGTGGFYLDDIELQSGINNIPNPTDYSNKVDSVVTRNDSSFYVTKGVYHYFKSGADSSKIYIQQAGAGETHIIRAANDTTLSVATLKNTDDITISKASDSSVLFNFTNPHYTKAQVDSIAATLTASGITRAELIDTANNKVNISDTAAMLSPYIQRVELQDTAAAIRADLAGGGGGGIKIVKQTYTSGSSVTVTDSTTWLIVNPASSGTLTINLASSPTDGQDLVISFGGTITSGAVITALTLSPSPIQASTPSYMTAGEALTYRWNATNSKWYRLN